MALIGLGRILSLLSGLAWAAQPQIPSEKSLPMPSGGSTSEVRFIRVYAPAERIEQWPWGTMKYVPVEGEEFERWIHWLQTPPDRQPCMVGVELARYTARFVEPAVLEGEASLQIYHQASEPRVLRWSNWGVAVRKVSWLEPKGQPAQPASFGLTESGQTELVVRSGGRLQFQWSSQGTKEPTGVIRFDLWLPTAPYTELLLDLPGELEPFWEGALIQPHSCQSEPGRKCWLLQWGGRLSGPLMLTPKAGATNESAHFLVEEEAHYTFLPEGLEAQVRFRLFPLQEPIPTLTARVDPGLEVVEVRLGEQSVPWRLEEDPQAQARRLWVECCPGRGKEGQVLEVRLVGPLRLDADWQIPRVRLEGSLWTEGRLTVRTVHPIMFQKVIPSGSRQVKADWLSSSETTPEGEYLEFQTYRADAGLEVRLSRRPPQLKVDTGTVVKMSERQINCRVRARLQAVTGEHFLVHAQVGRRWLIDGVEAEGASQVEDWSLEPAQGGRRRLSIWLTRPITPQRPVELLITGRRLQSPVGRSWPTEELIPVRFQSPPEGKRLVVFCTANSNYELIYGASSGFEPLNASELTPEDLTLVGKTTEGFLFWDDGQWDSLVWRVRPRPPRYRVKIHVDVLASEKSVLERYRIQCIPENARVERVLVVFSQSRPEPLQWTLPGDLQRQWSAHRLKEPPLLLGIAPQAEAWEIVLRPSRSSPFELLAERTTARRAPLPISLAAVPQATAQQATVRIRTVGPASPGIVWHRLEPIGWEEEDFVPGWTTQVARFWYDPKQELSGLMPPALALESSSDSGLIGQPCVWYARLESRWDPAGPGDHLAIYWLSSDRSSSLNIRFPLPSSLVHMEGIWLGQEPVRWTSLPSAPSELLSVRVDLPPQKTVCPLVLRYRTEGPPLSSYRRIQPPFPHLDLPIARRCWTLWLPPGWKANCPAEYCLAGRSPEVGIWERLFGPLARPNYQRVFDPLSLLHWKQIATGKSLEVERLREQAEKFFHTFGGLLIQGRPKPPASISPQTPGSSWPWTWAELLQQEAFQAMGKIWIDRQGVWEAGIDPSSPIRPVSIASEGAEAQVGRQVFWQAGLALGVQEGVILITSCERAASWTGLGPRLEDPQAWYVPAGNWLTQLEQPPRGTLPLWVSPSVWQESAQPSPFRLWSPADWQPDGGQLGWSAWRLEWPKEQPTPALQVEILHTSRRQGWYWAGMFSAAGLALVLVRRSLPGTLILAGLFAAAALLVPEPFWAISAGAFSGTAVVLGFWLVWPRSLLQEKKASASQPSGSAKAKSSSSGLIEILPTVLVAVGIWGGRELAFGAEASSASPPRPVYRVFIPIDQNEQPTGDPYQVPEPFYQYLRRRTQTFLPTVARWRLRQAIYRGELSWNPSAGRWEIPRLKVLWQWDLSGKVSQVSLPLGREEFVPISGTWLVEGQPIEPQWNDQANTLLLPVPVAGSTIRMEGEVRPVPIDQPTQQGIDLAIPPVPEARLELLLSPEAPELRLLDGLGAVQQLSEPSPRWVAELGPTGRIRLRWAKRTAASTHSAWPEVDELLWIHLQPGTVFLQARFRMQFSNASAGIDRLRVFADGRLRFLSLSPEPQQAIEITPSPGGQILLLPVPAPDPTGLSVVEAKFLLANTAGLGTVRLPRLEPMEAKLRKRWLAVSVDSCLEYPEPSPNRPQAVPVEDFLHLWGKADSPPEFVEDLPQAAAGWTLVTRPRIPNSSVEQTLALGYGEKTVRIWYEARLSTSSGASFQHRLQVPAQIQIEKISLVQGDKPQQVRWAQTADGILSIFSSAPLTGQYQLQLLASVELPPTQPHPIPYVQIETSEIEGASLELFRQPEITLRLRKSEGLTETDFPPVPSTKTFLGQPWRSFLVDPRQIAEVQVEVSPNRPEYNVRQIMLVRPDSDPWTMELDVHIEVQRGILDEIVFPVPPCWPGPYKISPPIPWVVQEGSEGQRGLIIRPPKPIEQTYQFRITGPLPKPLRTPLELPAIVASQASQSELLFVLPRQFQLQQFRWETQGLQKTALPPSLASQLGPSEAWQAYRAIEEPAVARLQALADSPQQPRVCLADFHLQWHSDASCTGTAEFFLLPAGQDRCLVCLPSGFQLLHLQVEDNPAPVHIQQGPGRYWVLLASSQLPQRLRVDFIGTLPEGVREGLRPFPAPWIDPWPTEVALWTIYPPAGYELAEPEGVARIPELRLEAYRLQTVGTLLEAGCRQMAQGPEGFSRWYGRWKEEFSRTVGELYRLLALPPTTELHRTVRAETQSWQLKLAQLAEQLNIPQPPIHPPQSRPPSPPTPKTWLASLQDPHQVCRAVIHQPSQGLLLSFLPKTRRTFPSDWLLAAGAASLFPLAWILRPSSPHLLLYGRPVLLVVLGGIWWLWLWPSAVGWLIMLAGVATAFRQASPRFGRSRSPSLW